MTSGPSGGRTPGVLSPVDWARLESMVDALLDTPLERRSALLDELSGSDPVRRSELDRLVAECAARNGLAGIPEPFVTDPHAQRVALVDPEADVIRDLHGGVDDLRPLTHFRRTGDESRGETRTCHVRNGDHDRRRVGVS